MPFPLPGKSSSPEPGGSAGPRLRVEPLASRHLEQVLDIEQTSFSQPWRRRLFEAELIYSRALCLGAFIHPDELLAGYLIMWVVVDEVQIQNIAVHSGLRGRGVGMTFMAEGLRLARARGGIWASLEVRPGNLAARRLYTSLGFTEVGRRPHYYQPEGEDAILMNRDLVASPSA
jgi:ribosomal-protein-alanine N-acetyltransferase